MRANSNIMWSSARSEAALAASFPVTIEVRQMRGARRMRVQQVRDLRAVALLNGGDEIVACVRDELRDGRRGEQQRQRGPYCKLPKFHDLRPCYPLDPPCLAEQDPTCHEQQPAILGAPARKPRPRPMGGAM